MSWKMFLLASVIIFIIGVYGGFYGAGAATFIIFTGTLSKDLFRFLFRHSDSSSIKPGWCKGKASLCCMASLDLHVTIR